MRTRGLTLIEMMVSIVLLSIISFGLFSLFKSTGDTSSLIHAQTLVQLEGERVMREVRDQLRRTGAGPGGNCVITPAGGLPANVDWEIQYNVLGGGDIFNEANPYGAIPWSDVVPPPAFGGVVTQRFVLRYEHLSGTAPTGPWPAADINTNNLDDDNDFLFNEGRLALYRIPNPVPPGIAPQGPLTLVKVIADNIFCNPLGPFEEIGARTRYPFTLAVERVLTGMLTTSALVADANTFRGGPTFPVGNAQLPDTGLGPPDLRPLKFSGDGPRVHHLVDVWLTLPN